MNKDEAVEYVGKVMELVATGGGVSKIPHQITLIFDCKTSLNVYTGESITAVGSEVREAVVHTSCGDFSVGIDEKTNGGILPTMYDVSRIRQAITKHT